MENSPPSLLDATENSLTISWSTASSALQYEIQMALIPDQMNDESKLESLEWISLSTKLTGNLVKKKNLLPDTMYIFRVRKKDRLGEWDFFSAPSEPFCTLAEGTPKMENGPVAQSVESDAVVLSWSAVEAAQCYELQMTDASALKWQTISSSIHQPTVRKKGLQSGASYMFRVRPLFSSVVESEALESKEPAIDWAFSPASNEIVTPVLASGIRSLLPNILIKSSGEQVSVDKLAGKVIALYCSAHWCGPCRKFTPQLVSFYQQMQHSGRPFEVIFISCDGDDSSMQSYFQEMPWLAVPFDDDAREEILSKYQVNGVPRLIVMDKKGCIMAENAVQSGLTEQHVLYWSQSQQVPQHSTAHQPQQQQSGGCCGGGCK